jgi:hypothetical protein
MLFDKSKTYRRYELAAQFVALDLEPSFVLRRYDEVFAFTVNRWQNPNAPSEILLSSRQGGDDVVFRIFDDKRILPIFIKENPNTLDWNYAGRFQLTRYSSNTQEIRKRLNPPAIPDIRLILFLQEVP